MTTNPTYKPNEGKREEFRRYLEKTGVMDALTKALVLLYEEPEKPDDALTFIQNSLSKQAGSETHGELRDKLEDMQNRIQQLEEDNRNLHAANDIVEEPTNETIEELPKQPSAVEATDE